MFSGIVNVVLFANFLVVVVERQPAYWAGHNVPRVGPFLSAKIVGVFDRGTAGRTGDKNHGRLLGVNSMGGKHPGLEATMRPPSRAIAFDLRHSG